MWDVGGQDKIRPLWRHYYQNTQGLIFVIDSNDRERIIEASEEFQGVLRNPELQNAPILIFANKQDLPNSMGVNEIMEKMKLHSLNSNKWHIQSTNALTGDGLYEGLDWLSSNIK